VPLLKESETAVPVEAVEATLLGVVSDTMTAGPVEEGFVLELPRNASTARTAIAINRTAAPRGLMTIFMHTPRPGDESGTGRSLGVSDQKS
jgi:hypothetical protein